jgi:glutamyl-Q tRNA(Asp) synthetase
LHLGHALSVLLNLDMARRFGGSLLIRIEDIDPTRCRQEFVAAILDDLAWLGIFSDGPVLRQSEHLPDYSAAAARLGEMGLLYPCFATRQECQTAALPGAVDPDGAPLYPGLHRNMPEEEVARRIASGQPFAMRLDMKRAIAVADERTGGTPLDYLELDEFDMPRRVPANPARWGDVVIQRKETNVSYHLAVVVDDDRQRITHVVRGADLQASTYIHRLLQVVLGVPEPIYFHHRLILDPTGRKLAKRAGDTTLAALRADGMTPADIRRLTGVHS